MPKFTYTGRSTAGKQSGSIISSSRREAIVKLKEKGIRVMKLEVVPESIFTKEITIGNPVKLRDFVIFLRQFSTLIRAGISVVDAANVLAQQTSSKALKRVLFDMEEEMKQGNPLSEAAAKHPKVFSTMFINMIKAGEASGALDDTLDRLATQFEKQHETKQKIVSALTYPAVLGVIAIGVVIFLLVGVVPTFVAMFSDFGAELPLITRFVLGASEWMQGYWWLLILIGLGFAVALMGMKTQKQTKYYIDYALLRMPIFGTLLQKAVIAKMTRTLSSLFSSSVPILQAISIVEKIVDNEVISQVISKSKIELEKGESLTGPMSEHWAFPPLVTQMISIGESTGSLDTMLEKIAEFYEKEVDYATDRLKSLIEPLMIVVLAIIVGTIVASILVPMFDIFNHIQM
ncbi:type II secretion system F family protein [Sutcliffiella rhizosphaerae]|uniref:Type II secretion system protein F n=1 Tax=Sutcliffiella rhizosphaerae TaxID=2880967 RepID=A0ABN8AA12_9BACI|nr:type II secretion system F family protein [Sutcliffiella rhizosphaerae]CAG9619510.1 Type II secretion system protein F [Sutcliffiella rhizosphaerae]